MEEIIKQKRTYTKKIKPEMVQKKEKISETLESLSDDESLDIKVNVNEEVIPLTENQKKIIAYKKRDEFLQEEVTGKFFWDARPNATMKFFHDKTSNGKTKTEYFKDKQIYTITRKLAEHLNDTGRITVDKHTMDKDGNPAINIGEEVILYRFASLDFTKDAYLNKDSRIVKPEQPRLIVPNKYR